MESGEHLGSAVQQHGRWGRGPITESLFCHIYEILSCVSNMRCEIRKHSLANITASPRPPNPPADSPPPPPFQTPKLYPFQTPNLYHSQSPFLSHFLLCVVRKYNFWLPFRRGALQRACTIPPRIVLDKEHGQGKADCRKAAAGLAGSHGTHRAAALGAGGARLGPNHSLVLPDNARLERPLRPPATADTAASGSNFSAAAPSRGAD